MLGIKITSTLGLNDERVDNEKTRSIVIVVLVILILLSLFGGIYMFKEISSLFHILIYFYYYIYIYIYIYSILWVDIGDMEAVR